MRRLSLALCLILFATGVRAGQLRSPGSHTVLDVIDPGAAQRIEGLERWLKAVARHTPGEDDEPLQEIAGGRTRT